MFERHLLPELQSTLTDTPVTLLTGTRQVGKSTLAHAVIPPSKRFTLDDLSVQASARADPVGFVAGLPDGCLLDEIQRVPELLLPIKASVDRDRRPGRFLLTGSANVLTLPRVAGSLAGRLGLLHLWPLSQGELAGQREDFPAALFGDGPLEGSTPENLIQSVLRGGYPEVVGRTSDRRDAWFSDYLRTLIERDVRDLSRTRRAAASADPARRPHRQPAQPQRCGA